MGFDLDAFVDDAHSGAEPAGPQADGLTRDAAAAAFSERPRTPRGSPDDLPPGSQQARSLIDTVVRGALIIDDPWRHAYLRRRWTGLGERKANDGHGD